jgi:hypothetical protein
LTCDFWAENAKNKCKRNKQQQIPFGDDNQKEKGKNKSKGNSDDLQQMEPYWMVRLTVAVWMVEPPVAVTVTA